MLSLALLSLLAQAPSPPSTPPGPPPGQAPTPDPFAGFETLPLANGLKLWFKRMPGRPIVSISVAIPFGADQDPRGKEQLAHFTEHILFGDRPDRSEEEIKREIEERGGVYNASVFADRSFYFLHIGKAQAPFALEWLYRILAPRPIDPDLVARQRGPVALEVGARPRQLLDWIWAYYLNPPLLRLPGFWEREFGVETRAARDYYPYASLSAITPRELRCFYDTYYVPSLMTLTVVGDIDRDTLLRYARRTFATLPTRRPPPPPPPLRDPNRYRQTILWAYRSDVYYSRRLKFYELSADDEVMLIFVARLLSKRLNDRLRFGERKATYGLQVRVVKRGRATYLEISGGVKPQEFDFARRLVEEEIERLRRGQLPTDEFERDRAAVTRKLQVANSGPDDLERWVRAYFYDPRIYHDFPDLVAAFAGYRKADLERFARRFIVSERQVLTIVYPHPIRQALLAVLAAALVWLAVRAARLWLTLPADMTRIRYVARFKVPQPYKTVAGLLTITLFALAGRLVVYVFQLVSDRLVLSLESFVLQASAYAAMLVAAVLLTAGALAHVPRKVLVFEDELRIKYLSYRSVAVPMADIVEISLRRFAEVWLSKRLWRCLPLALGLVGPAVYVRRRDGRAYFFDVRDKSELVGLLSDLVARCESNAQRLGRPI